MRKLKGFTLIELLVVVAIIGILATVIVVNLSSSQAKARDAAALSSLQAVQTAAVSCTIGTAYTLTAPTAGNDICSTPVSFNWPSLASNNWQYDAATSSAGTGDVTFFTSTNSGWQFGAFSGTKTTTTGTTTYSAHNAYCTATQCSKNY